MIARAPRSPCPAMARGWRLGRSEMTATVTTQATCGSMTTMAVLGLKSVADIDGEAADDQSGLGLPVQRWHAGGDWGALNDSNGNDSGHVRVYDYNGSAWAQVGDDIDGEAADDLSGYSVSLSSDGTRVAIGAPLNDSNGNDSGHVRVYDYNGNAWAKVGDDIDGEAADDLSGSLSPCQAMARGWRLGRLEMSSSAGHVRVYEYSGGGWAQLGTDIDGEAADDQSGFSVSLSSDGTRVAIGAPLNDSNGNNSGHVRVYRFASASSAATPVPTLPLFGLGILVSLLGLFGLRKLRQ